MYYNRILSHGFARFLKKGGELRWLVDFAAGHKGVDLQTGKSSTKQWISVFYGPVRLFSIRKFKGSVIFIDSSEETHNLSGNFYGRRDAGQNFQDEIGRLIAAIEKEPILTDSYRNSKKVYYRNLLSRRYGICSNPDDDFVIIDVEAAPGYRNEAEKNCISGSNRMRYKQLFTEVSRRCFHIYSKDFQKMSFGNGPDILALDKSGNILIMNIINRYNPSSVCFGLMETGLYFDIFSALPWRELETSVLEMLSQKQKNGLINSSWLSPAKIKNLIPVLIIPDYNHKSATENIVRELLDFIREKYIDMFPDSLKVSCITPENGLTDP